MLASAAFDATVLAMIIENSPRDDKKAPMRFQLM